MGCKQYGQQQHTGVDLRALMSFGVVLGGVGEWSGRQWGWGILTIPEHPCHVCGMGAVDFDLHVPFITCMRRFANLHAPLPLRWFGVVVQ
jgi:hypothetical protein